MTIRELDITILYVAFFDRVPDAEGLNYWVNSDLDLEEINASFFEQPETHTKYPEELTNEDFIIEVYANLFGRSPDTGGLEYWLQELESGQISRSVFISAVVNGAQGDDKVTVENKTDVAQYALENGLTDGDYDLGDVTADPQSVEDATQEIKDDVNPDPDPTPTTPWTVTAEAQADGIHVNSNEDASAGLYDGTNTLIGVTKILTANTEGVVTVTAQASITETDLKVERASDNTWKDSIEVFLGTMGADTYIGDPTEDNVFYGFAGDDTILINATGTASDSVFGGNGDDTVHVGDQLDAGDVIDGGNDTDTLVVKGSITDAQFVGVSNMEGIVFSVGSTHPEGANATLGANALGNPLLSIDGTDDAAYSDWIDLTNAPVPAAPPAPGVTVNGNKGDDTLIGNAYATLRGGDGVDTIKSVGVGVWNMFGNAGIDLFVIGDEPSSTHTPTINDFQSSEKIDFSPQQLDGNAVQDPLLAADFDSTIAALTDGDPMTHLVEVAGDTNVYVDVNHDSFFREADDIMIIVTNTSGTPLDYTDFFI